jgi:hypothetical protein
MNTQCWQKSKIFGIHKKESSLIYLHAVFVRLREKDNLPVRASISIENPVNRRI